MEVVLASASPRRRQLLRAVGLRFTVDPARGPEEVIPGERPEGRAARLALAKAREVAQRHPEALVIGADTLVVHPSGEIFGKPSGPEEARRMLTRLAGRWHTVVTGVAVVLRPAPPAAEQAACEVERTRVRFRSLSPEQIERYVASGEPLDKAGAYGIQEKGALLVQRIEGCYFNVVGLPIPRLAVMLQGFGVKLL